MPEVITLVVTLKPAVAYRRDEKRHVKELVRANGLIFSSMEPAKIAAREISKYPLVKAVVVMRTTIATLAEYVDGKVKRKRPTKLKSDKWYPNKFSDM